MECRICKGRSVAARSVRTRAGENKKLFYCPYCDFAFFGRDCADLIVADKFEKERLTAAGLRIPDIRTDFNNGIRQSLEYKKAYIRASDRGKAILEIGPSWGYFLKVLKSAGVKAAGLELNPMRAEFVRRNLKIPCYEKLEEIEKKGLRFRKIFLFYVIQYIKDPLDYLSRLVRLLEAGGRIYIVTPNHHDVLKEIWKIGAYQDFFYEKMTVSYYSAGALKKLAAAVSRRNDISFNVATRQGYSFVNHAMWYLDGKPRTTGIVGGDAYIAGIERKLSSSSTRLGLELAKLTKEFDRKYRSAIEKYDSGNQVILTITKK